MTKATVVTISDKLTLTSIETDDDVRCTHYKCDVEVTLAGDSAWDCELTAADDVRISDIYVNEGVQEDTDEYDGNIGYRHIMVYYAVNGKAGEELEGTWRIYTDTGFEACVSELLGEEIYFTEQGMQDNGVASME
jgi:hypothetical protein